MPATDRNEWAEIYEEDVSHMLTLQQRLASDLAVAAGQRQLVARRIPQATDLKAYDAYAKGLTAQGQQRCEGFRRAVAYFEEAVAILPDFAEAQSPRSRGTCSSTTKPRVGPRTNQPTMYKVEGSLNRTRPWPAPANRTWHARIPRRGGAVDRGASRPALRSREFCFCR